MQTRERLNDYLAELRERLRWAILTRAGAAIALCILVILCGAIVWLAPLGFPVLGVIATRVVLLAALLLAVALLLWRPLQRLRAHGAASTFEKHLPQQQGRIQTFLELQERKAQGESAPMLDLLANDAWVLTKQSPIDGVVSSRRLWIGGSIAIGATALLIYFLVLGHAQWGYGTRHVLLGTKLPAEAVPVHQLFLQPGDITVRRNGDLAVQARIKGFKPHEVQLFVRFAEGDVDKQEWERAAMQVASGDEVNRGEVNRDGASRYQLTLYALRAPLEYYAVADGVKSDRYKVNVVDVPRIESLKLTYNYPQWTGLSPKVETEVRDIRAVAETQVQLSVKASEPLNGPVIVREDGESKMQTASVANISDGSMTVSKAGRYHLSAQVAGELVALTDDYDIDVLNDEPPTIEIAKPGRDWRATSVEEVPVVIRAQDDFRVQQLELKYSVNGGTWRNIAFPAGTKQVEVKSILQMEELGGKTPLVPGDLVTYYAVTRDRKQSAQTDLFLVQVQPFDRRFSEAQGGGGGGGGDGGGSEQQQIAERQRELLIATWNLDRAREQKRRTPQQLQESATLLSDLQTKLAEQTTTLVERTRARAKVEADARVKQFVESLELAVKAMQPTATHLNAMELQAAVPGEQQALQMLLRAESAFREIQVARQQDNQGGNGGSRTSRDISELYELEMDLNKNKYETEKEVSQQAQAPSQEVDEAVAKLRELAQRQEKLAEQQRQNQTPTNADRWRQEQLRREAEELKRQLQEMARQQAQQGQGQNQSQSQNSGQGQPGSSAQELKAALNAVENALESMRQAEKENATRSKSNDKSANAAEEASRNLRQAARTIEPNGSQQSLNKAVEQLADRAKQVAAQQRGVEAEIYKAIAKARDQESTRQTRRDGLAPTEAKRLADEKQKVLNEFERLEKDLRQTTQGQRAAAPKTAQRLAEIVDELSNSNLSSRLANAIVDLERGRADQSVMGEGLVTEALQNAASDLRDASKLATQEARDRAESAEPQSLLAELAELRRALQSAQRGQQSGQQPGQQSGQQSGQQQGQSQNQQQGQPGQQSASGGGARTGGLAEQRIGDGDWLRTSGGIRQQLDAIQNRIASGTISQADLQALRAIVPRVRTLAGNPLGDRNEVLKSVERLELAALSAVQKSRKQAPARAGSSSATTAQDAETVAEYYRRLAK